MLWPNMKANLFILPRRLSSSPTPIYNMHESNTGIMLIYLAPVIMKIKSIPACIPPQAAAIQNSTVSKFT